MHDTMFALSYAFDSSLQAMLSASLLQRLLFSTLYASLQATPSVWIHTKQQLVIGYNLCLFQSAYSCEV
jgi:hypothetical protein